MSILQFETVSKDYVSEGVPVPALHEVTLEFQRGEFAALSGRSGCGKSTLLNLAGAMDFPTSGRVILDGVPTSSLDDSGLTRLRRTKVGFIFQSFQLLPTLSVAENVELPLLLAGETRVREAALRRLRQVEMEEYAATHAFPTLRRADAARGHRPRPGPFAPDPAGGRTHRQSRHRNRRPDPRVARRIASEERTTILMATHSAEAAAIADTLVRLKDGRVAEIRPIRPEFVAPSSCRS